MESRERYRPFTNDDERRIRFDRAPLELVVVQVRWPQLTALSGGFDDVAMKFGSSNDEYPLLETGISYDLSPNGPVLAPNYTVYEWNNTSRTTAVSLSVDALTFFTKAYESYEDFSAEFRKVLGVLDEVVKMPLFGRLSVRYVNRIYGFSDYRDISTLLKPELLGHQSLHAGNEETDLIQSVSQSLYRVGEGNLLVRSGMLSPHDTVDPVIPPLSEPSWILDIDSFIEREFVFSPDAVMEWASRLSDAAYDFFKLIIEKGFFEEFGGREVE